MKVLISMLLMFSFFMLFSDDLKKEKQEKKETLKTEKAIDNAKHLKMLKDILHKTRIEKSGLKNGKSEAAGKIKMSAMGRIGNRGKEGRENDPDLDTYSKSPAEAGLAIDKGKGKERTSKKSIMEEVQKLFLKNLFTRVERGDRPGHENDSDHEKYTMPSYSSEESSGDEKNESKMNRNSFMSPVTDGGWDKDSNQKQYQTPAKSGCGIDQNCSDIRNDLRFELFKKQMIFKVGRPADPEF